MSETEPTREELEALRDMTSFERRGALLISERAVICLALEALDRRAELATLTAQVAAQVQEIERLKLAHVADTQAVSAYQRQIEDAMIVLAPNMPSSGLVDACKQVKQVAISEAENSTMLDRKWQKQAQEIERLRREWGDAVERERRLAPSLADTQMMARDAQAKLRAVEALRDNLSITYQATLNIWPKEISERLTAILTPEAQ